MGLFSCVVIDGFFTLSIGTGGGGDVGLGGYWGSNGVGVVEGGGGAGYEGGGGSLSGTMIGWVSEVGVA